MSSVPRRSHIAGSNMYKHKDKERSRLPKSARDLPCVQFAPHVPHHEIERERLKERKKERYMRYLSVYLLENHSHILNKLVSGLLDSMCYFIA